MKEEANLFLVVLNYYIIIFKEQISEDLNHTISPDWIASEKTTINKKNEKDNECFKW